jgi:hypothetical protein
MTNSRLLRLSNGANWALKADITLNAVSIENPNRIYSIPEYSVATTFTNPIAAFLVLCPDARAYWTYGGYARQTISAGLPTGQNFNTIINLQHRLTYGKVNIKFFPTYILEYGLKVTLPWYMRRASLTVWEYIGTDIDLLYQTVQQTKTNTIEILSRL